MYNIEFAPIILNIPFCGRSSLKVWQATIKIEGTVLRLRETNPRDTECVEICVFVASVTFLEKNSQKIIM
jgi:hypothetical protein